MKYANLICRLLCQRKPHFNARKGITQRSILTPSPGNAHIIKSQCFDNGPRVGGENILKSRRGFKLLSSETIQATLLVHDNIILETPQCHIILFECN